MLSLLAAAWNLRVVQEEREARRGRKATRGESRRGFWMTFVAVLAIALVGFEHHVHLVLYEKSMF